MKNYVHLLILAIACVAQVFAQSPAGWKVRPDRSMSALDPDAAGAIQFVTMGSGFDATNPQAAVYWNPANTATGVYTLKGTFTLMRPSGHVNYYGLVFGANDLDGPQQKYLYFMVAQDGTWLVKRRDGSSTSDLAGRMPNKAVKKLDASGKSTNMLEVRVGANKIDFAVNGAVVHSMPRSGLKTDGIYGIRINHLLEVHIDGFGVSR